MDHQGLREVEIDGVTWYMFTKDNLMILGAFVDSITAYTTHLKSIVVWADTAWTLCGEQK